ncbi:MAG: helix-turn-helix domain-containing protein [Flavobacteriaceae bacterium]|nr:MAG: helix-turn-helix domain-containing protein [Flavobacteriaceae bacterium]
MKRKHRSQNTQDKVAVILEKIITRRKKLKITQADLASQLNISLSGYFKIEKGNNKLDIYRLIEITEILQIDLGSFFKGRDKQ